MNVRMIARILLLTLCATTYSAEEPPRRIVSLNLASDQLCLMLIDPSRIAALSSNARSPDISLMWKEAADIPLTNGAAEEVMKFQPDLVIAGTYTTLTSSQLLEQIGIPVYRMKIPKNYADIRTQTLELAKILHAEDRANELLAEMDARLNRLAKQTVQIAHPKPALVFGQNGYTQGAGTLMHEVIQAAGLSNHATRIQTSKSHNVSIESLILNPPAIVITTPHYDKYPSLGGMLETHPALRRRSLDLKKVPVPLSLVIVGSPRTVEASELLFRESYE